MNNPVEGATLSHFRILERLGSGGMGEVYRAEDNLLHRVVAVKLLPPDVAADPEHIERFYREANALAALNHPNIVTIFSVEKAQDVHFIVTEYIKGKTLDLLIPVDGLPLKRILDISIPVADGLNMAHDAGITHRDLKPSNIMVSDSGQAKILDFGLAKMEKSPILETGSQIETGPLTGEGRLIGTLLYMSPEQMQGKSLDFRSDIFSFGVLLYEMSTGRRPFQGETTAELISAILRDDPVPVKDMNSGLPETLVWVIARCLKKRPEERPQSMLEIRNELNDLYRTELDREEKKHSIAVLPFHDMSPDRDQEYFCEGIAEELIHVLNKTKIMRVASRTSSFHYRKAALDIRDIGRRLNVGTILEGSVRKVENRLRVTVELVNIVSGYTLWSERYDRDFKDVFAIQDEIAQNIVHSLEAALTTDAERAGRKESTPDVQAYDFYLRGKKFYYQYDRKAVEFAFQMFTRATELDPHYAQAYSGVADCCCYLYANAGRRSEDLTKAVEASRRALQLNSNLAEAHTSRAEGLALSGQTEEAEKEFDLAIRLDPDLFEARYFYARHCFAEGKLEKAVRLYEQASLIRPEDYQSPLLVAQVYADLGRMEEARAARRRGRAIAEEHLTHHPDDIRALYMGANGLVAMGDREAGLVWAGRAMDLEPAEPMVLYNLACVYSLAQEQDRAIDCLERAVKQGFTYTEWVDHDSNLDPIRNHPRFHKIMLALGASAKDPSIPVSTR